MIRELRTNGITITRKDGLAGAKMRVGARVVDVHRYGFTKIVNDTKLDLRTSVSASAPKREGRFAWLRPVVMDVAAEIIPPSNGRRSVPVTEVLSLPGETFWTVRGAVREGTRRLGSRNAMYAQIDQIESSNGAHQ